MPSSGVKIIQVSSGVRARADAPRLNLLMKTILLSLIRLYRSRVAHRWRYSVCPKRVSCSKFAEKAIRKHGAFRGIAIASTRIRTCK